MGPYPSAEESGFLTPSATSTGPQPLSGFVEGRPGTGAAEVVQNLFRVWTVGLKVDLYERSTSEDGETVKTVLEDEAQQPGLVLRREYLDALWFLTCNIHGPVTLLREICGLSIY